jgi:hypothetical protein
MKQVLFIVYELSYKSVCTEFIIFYFYFVANSVCRAFSQILKMSC